VLDTANIVRDGDFSPVIGKRVLNIVLRRGAGTHIVHRAPKKIISFETTRTGS